MSDSESSSDLEYDDDFNEISDKEDNVEHKIAENNSTPKNSKPNRHLQQLCDTLELDKFKDKMTLKREKRKRQKERRRLLKKNLQKSMPEQPKMVQTLASKNSAKASKFVPEVVVFKDPAKRKKGSKKEGIVNKSNKNIQPEDVNDGDKDEISMKQARFDVFKFGIRGLDKDGQHEARVALALKLGAKPEKKICKPYAEYKMEVQHRKEEIQKQKELDRMTGMKKVSARPLSTKKSNAAKNSKDSNNTKKTKSKQNEKTPLKMGKFDGGTLRISQKEVAKMRK